MSKTGSFVKDNRGSTLLMVIISIAFISILCSLLLSLTVINVQMKSTNYKAQANFYETEEIFEKMKMGIEEETAEAVKYAYEEVMKVYISQTEAYKKTMFKEVFLNKLESLLTTGDNYKNVLTRYVAANPNIELNIDAGQLEKTTESIRFKNVKVSYEDEHQYKTIICTDIVIEIPDMGFNIVPNFPPAFSSYGLLADNQIKLGGTVSGAKIHGDVYAGNGGILLEAGSDLVLENPNLYNIVTRGNITVKNQSSLTVKGNPAIWAKNIETLQDPDKNGEAKISINGKCYIKDDLMLGADNSNVILEGEYFGYGYHSNNLAEDSSAIIINGKGSKLDMEKVNKLTIAGRAFINASGGIQTGESLAIKNNQYAYLVPDEYMWCGTNPVTFREFGKFNIEKSTHPEMQEVLFDSKGEFKLSDYTTECEKVFSIDHENLVYYYLIFPSEEIANQYLQDYYKIEANKKNVDEWIQNNASDIRVTSPTKSIVSVGNVFSYTNEGTIELIPNHVNPNEVSTNNITAIDYLKRAADDLAGRYERIVQTLSDMPSKEANHPDSLYKSIVKSETIEADLLPGASKEITIGEYVVCIVNNKGVEPYYITSDFKGMVIATGSVQVSKDFTGLILSGDTISLGSNVSVTADDNIVKDIIKANNPEVNKYLRDYSDAAVTGENITSIGSPYDVSDLISYENWTKNEE